MASRGAPPKPTRPPRNRPPSNPSPTSGSARRPTPTRRSPRGRSGCARRSPRGATRSCSSSTRTRARDRSSPSDWRSSSTPNKGRGGSPRPFQPGTPVAWGVLHVSELLTRLGVLAHEPLDLVLPGEVPGGRETLTDHLALVDELQSLVARRDLHEHVALAPDDRHAARSVGRQVRLRLRAVTFRGLLAPEREGLHEHLDGLRLAAPNRRTPRGHERCVSRHTPPPSEQLDSSRSLSTLMWTTEGDDATQSARHDRDVGRVRTTAADRGADRRREGVSRGSG